MTDAERLLWKYLRNRGFQGAKFRRQWTIGPFIADFACVELRLVIEVDGGQHAESESDAQRTAWLESVGWHVIRYWNNDVLGNIGGVLQAMSLEIEQTPLPPAGAGGARREAVGG